MYRVVRASILYYDNNMRNAGVRYGLIKPFLLLTDTKKFNEAKVEGTKEYQNLCDIVIQMRRLYATGEAIYHHFGMLLEELDILGFSIDNIKEEGMTSAETLKDQVDFRTTLN